MERNRFNVIHDIYGPLDLVKEMIEPVIVWKYYVSQWDVEEQRIFLLKLIAISKKEIREGRQGSDLDRYASYLASYLSRKINGARDTKQEVIKTEVSKKPFSSEAEKYFNKAIQAKLMKKREDDTYEWLHNNGLKASLGYFLNRVFNPKGTSQIPYKCMESLFNMSRLDTAIDQALTAKKPQKWRTEIDTLFDD